MSRCYLSLPGSMDTADHELHATIASAERSFEAWCDEADRLGQHIPDRTAFVYLYDANIPEAPHCCDWPDVVLTMGPRGGLRRENCR